MIVGHGILVTISGSAGVGKDTVVRSTLPRLSRMGVAWVPSVVTRRPRPTDDPDGYRYVDRGTFLNLLSDSVIMESADVEGELYGTPSDAFQAGPSGGIKILTVDGLRSVRAWMDEHSVHPGLILSIYLVAPDSQVLKRLHDRGWDDEKIASRRSFDLPGYSVAGVPVDDAWMWDAVLNNADDRLDLVVDAVVAMVGGLVCESNEKLRGSTTSAPDPLPVSGTGACSPQPVRGLWPPPEGSGSMGRSTMGPDTTCSVRE